MGTHSEAVQGFVGLGHLLRVQRDAEGFERVQVYGVAIGAEATKKMALLIDELRANGISADMAYGGRGLKGAMKGADRSGAHTALVLGDRELEAGEVTVKNLEDHSQKTVALDAGAIIDAIFLP